MDIIDIMLAKAMTPQGKTEAYVAKANKAAQQAAKARDDADAAIASVTAAAEDIASAQEAASQLLEDAQDALETAQSAQINMPEVYTTTGQNTDGYMTQKAVTDALAAKADASSLNVYVTTTAMDTALAAKANTSALDTYATKQYVEAQIATIPSGGGSGNANTIITSDDAGHIVTVDDNGNLVASRATDTAVIEALLQTGTYTAVNAVGLDVNYANRTCTRIQEAQGKTMGANFNSYSMYGGRTKCNVADNGTINAFYGDNNYTEDGSNGQVMVYQPKFYYSRIIYSSDAATRGRAIRHEALMISPTEQQGFKLAPAFAGGLDYILLPAYDGSVINNKLASIAGVKPINNLTRDQAETYATARGTGWHIMNMAAESANQMLQMVEFGTMNGQAAIEEGITYTPDGTNGQCMFITGSTAALGNGTGHAAETIMDVNGTRSTVNADGNRAIIYRGMENPWGNLWSMIGGTRVVGNSTQEGGVILICKDFNYSGNNYDDIGFNLPAASNWVNAMGYGSEAYDWVYMPIEVSNTASSLAPVGDYLWTIANLNGETIVATGGSFGYKEECGPFYYAADRTLETSARHNYGAKLMYIPTKNEIYTANIAKWNTYMGG